MENIIAFTNKYLNIFHMPTKIVWTDIVEILIISFLVYHLLLWVRDTKAWTLLKGFVVIIVFLVAAAFFNLSTILWLAEKVFSVGIIAVVILLQPELRRALEQLGNKGFKNGFLSLDLLRTPDGNFSDKTLNEIIEAAFDMGKVKTGALIVVEQNQELTNYEDTGIAVDAVVSAALLKNIFEHNTPLHDGAVIIRGDRVMSATCYLPLSDSTKLSKKLGTRHRAGVGVSELTDSMTVIVSEETGRVSVAYEGKLRENVDKERLKELLCSIQNKPEDEKLKKSWKGRLKREENKN